MSAHDTNRPAIYALVDPRDHLARYVGSTWNLRNRLRKYKYPDSLSFRRRNAVLAEWLVELRENGTEFVVVVLSTEPFREQEWIDRLLREGHPLTNWATGRSPFAEPLPA